MEAERETAATLTDPRTRLVIADEQPMFRECFAAWLKHESWIELIGEASSGQEAVEISRRLQPDILLLDLNIPEGNGIQVLQSLQQHSVRVHPVLLCGTIKKEETLRAIQLGARGIILKTETMESLLGCIRTVKRGDYWVDGDALATIVQSISDQIPVSDSSKLRYGITQRELDVMRAVAAGRSNVEIAGQLDLSVYTVKRHLTRIFDKVGVYSRLELALFTNSHQLFENNK